MIFQACKKTCYQQHVILWCGCGDPAYPMQGQSLYPFYPADTINMLPCVNKTTGEGKICVC